MTEKSWKHLSKAVIAAFVGVMLLSTYKLLMALFSNNDWEPPKAGDWAAWFGALGTFGALLGTIRLASSETMRREAAEFNLARIAAANFWVMLPETIAVIDKIFERMQLPYPTQDPITWRAEGAALDVVCEWSDDDLVRLTPLPNHTAAKLAMARAELRYMARKFQGAAITFDVTAAADRYYFDREMHTRLIDARMYIKDSFVECEAILDAKVI